MADDSEQNKTEKATSHKLRKAREQGQVAKGMDLGLLAALSGLLGYGWARGDVLRGAVASSAVRALVAAPQIGDDNSALLHAAGALVRAVIEPMALLAGTIWLVVLVLEVVQTGPVFAPARLKPDFSRLNPITGLKRLFTVRTLIEAAKSIAKMAIYIAIGWLLVSTALPSQLVGLVDAGRLADTMIATGFRLLLWCALAALLIALADQFLARRQFAKMMRMSRRELRRELRDQEGEPRIKQRRKQIHREFAKLGKSLAQVRNADVVIVNPVHYAIGLRYVPSRMAAPRVVARGMGAFALILKNIAFRSSIPIISEPALARALFARAKLDAEVDERFYVEIAKVYRENKIIPKG